MPHCLATCRRTPCQWRIGRSTGFFECWILPGVDPRTCYTQIRHIPWVLLLGEGLERGAFVVLLESNQCIATNMRRNWTCTKTWIL